LKNNQARYIHTANSMKTELVELQDALQEELRRLQIYDEENKDVKCEVLELLLNPRSPDSTSRLA
jgi:hypothetical protein